MPPPKTPRKNLLFICSRNRWRSPTAERVFSRHPGLSVRSRGLREGSPRKLSANDLAWADWVFVMEKQHRILLNKRFPSESSTAKIHVLNIPDDFHYMDPELVTMLESRIAHLLSRDEEH